jgi:hypothetical protein
MLRLASKMVCLEKRANILRAIRDKDASVAVVRGVYEDIDRYSHATFSKKVWSAAQSALPKVYVASTFLEECTFAANTTCDYFRQPLEVSGVVMGKRSSNRILLKHFHTYMDQTCTAVRTSVSGIGSMRTHRHAKKFGDAYCCDAHSHHKMNVFHSGTDYDLLRRHTTNASKVLKVDVAGVMVEIPYAVNVVFNNKTSKVHMPHILGCMHIPQYDAHGKRTLEELFEEPSVQVLRSESITNRDKRRLYKEISERVSLR